MIKTITAILSVALVSLNARAAHGAEQPDRPNILWISLEDITPMMGCYGDTYARTPVFDKLAAEGIRYTKAHSIAPVCSVSRSSIITGMYPTSLGTHHHRSNVGQPPAFVKMLPNLMRLGVTGTSRTAQSCVAARAIWSKAVTACLSWQGGRAESNRAQNRRKRFRQPT